MVVCEGSFKHPSKECVGMLLGRGAEAVELDAADRRGATALHYALTDGGYETIVELLLQAGANPTIRNKERRIRFTTEKAGGETPLDVARRRNDQSCIALLAPAVAEPQRPRLLLKTRALLDAAHAAEKSDSEGQKNGLGRKQLQRAALGVVPPYLRGRVAYVEELPRVGVIGGEDELVACVKYALGLEGGGGVVIEGEEPAVGMVKEVFVELCKMLVPKWDRPNV